ncbi:unnamed protein product [Staurois parvus]|uniref:Uncharacterized protein n=1 Tax=Staurois parvus TaxID=386267 RepID=A0ABN9F1E7_9NEOB|nr:unnamed protein product [Staurois parvus]
MTGDIYTDNQGTDHQHPYFQCSSISAVPLVPKKVHQCSISVSSMQHISAHQGSKLQCHLSVSISASCQCPSVPHISAHQCHISVPI